MIERVSLKNYKSIVECSVALRPLTVIVGRNGSGKSNFIDSLHFVSDALASSLEFAIRTRGGIRAVAHKTGRGVLSLEIVFRPASSYVATFTVSLIRGVVSTETLTIKTAAGEPVASYRRKGRVVEGEVGGRPLDVSPTVLPDRLALVALSGAAPFREPFDALVAMRFYRLDPEAMREVRDPDEGDVLASDGANIASVWRRLQKSSPTVARRLTSYLAAITPGMVRIHHKSLGPKEALHFHQAVRGSTQLLFYASSMSDGTLRALGALVASRPGNGLRAAPGALVMLEEPETALHPAAVAALMDALHEASGKTQIIVTSHSADVLDQIDFESDALLVTDLWDGVTTIGEINEASREAIRRHLYTAGDLLRMDQLQPGSRGAPISK